MPESGNDGGKGAGFPFGMAESQAALLFTSSGLRNEPV